MKGYVADVRSMRMAVLVSSLVVTSVTANAQEPAGTADQIIDLVSAT